MKRRFLCMLLCTLLALTSVLLFSCGGDDTVGEETGETTAVEETTAAETKAPKVVEVKVTTPPTKTSYEYGEEFDATGMVVTLVYDDGTTEVTEKYKTKPSGPLGLGVAEVTVSYSTKKTTTPVTVSSPFEGKGTADDPYLIKSAEEFIIFSDLMASSQVDGAYFKQTVDLDFTSENADKIGVIDSVTFNGFYDGAGHTIGMAITKSGGSYNLFPHVGGYVINLGTYGYVTGTSNVGGISRGTTGAGFVANCWSSATLTNHSVAGITYHNVGKVAHSFYIGEMSGSNRAYPTTSTTASSSGGPAINLYYSTECVTPTTSYTQNRTESTGMALADMLTQTFLDELASKKEESAALVGIDAALFYDWKLEDIVTLEEFKKAGQDKVASVLASFDGEGTAENPYLIQNEEDFVSFNELMSQNYVDGLYFKQTANLDFTADSSKIGAPDSAEFKATYDGAGHTIGISISTSDTYSLFPHISGVVMNLGVYGTNTGNNNIGGIARRVLAGGAIVNCWSSVVLDGNKSGGLAYHNLGKIANSFYIGSVSGTERCYTTSSTTESSSGGPFTNVYYAEGCNVQTGTSYDIHRTDSTAKPLADMLTQAFLDELASKKQESADFVGVDVSLLVDWKIDQIVPAPEKK